VGLKALLHTHTPNHREQYQLCAILQAVVGTTSAHSGDFRMAKFHNFFKRINFLLSKVSLSLDLRQVFESYVEPGARHQLSTLVVIVVVS